MRKMLFLAFALLCAHAVHAQKYEKEYRIRAQDAPPPARQFIDSLPFKKVKWYYEERLHGHSIEAKAVKGKRRYSIEFDSLGTLEDVEIGIIWEEIPEYSRKSISASLDSLFDSFKMQQMQVQYTGKQEAMLEIIRTQKTRAPHTTKYEIVLKGKKGREVKLYEMLFDEHGKINAVQEIIFKSSDNLEY